MNGHLDPSQLRHDAAPAGDERDRILEHVASCADCRGAWIAADASRLFGILATEPVPDAFLDRLTARIDGELQQASGSRLRRGRAAGWLSLAASLALAAVLGGGMIGMQDPVADRWAEATGETDSPAEFPVAEFQLLASPGEAQVLDLSVGGTSVVMIFDQELDI